MNVKTYRAKTMQEALALVRDELGSGASVLQTREVRQRGLTRWWGGTRLIEVVASATVSVPSRLPATAAIAEAPVFERLTVPQTQAGIELNAPLTASDARAACSVELFAQLTRLQSKLDVQGRRSPGGRSDLPDHLFHLFTDLIESDVDEQTARGLIERIRDDLPPHAEPSTAELKHRLAGLVEREISVAGEIQLAPGQRRLVALVGPTGVGKTTTIAKLAARYRLREKRRVGLITVDTYRVAAVEQLRTYADIIDLPMEIVSTPREMQQAAARLADLDLVLLDTAGHSPRDEVKLRELKSVLSEAQPDEVHLVLSSVAGASALARTAEQFAPLGITSLLLTKLDEADSLGNLLSLLRCCRLPLSYLTNGQNVPDDIVAADGRLLARAMLSLESVSPPHSSYR